MHGIPVVDVAGYLPPDLMHRPDLWPAGPQRSGAYANGRGLAAFASRSEYAVPTTITVTDSERRLHLSVWLRDGMSVDAEGRRFQVAGRQTVAGFMPGARWRTSFQGAVHHVGLLLAPDCLAALAGEQGEDFFDALQRDGCMRIRPGDTDTLRVARELESVLLDPASLRLMREAKSLELLGCLLLAGQRHAQAGLGPLVRERLHVARERLLRDLAEPPTLVQLAAESGLNTFALKRGFKALFGMPAYALYQRERMRRAWELIASGRMTASEVGGELGYGNLSHFGAAFRRAHGMLPGEVRRQVLAQGSSPKISLNGDIDRMSPQ
ncbi:helix-turn-helix domain-containing protein [Acidovorax sacchari]|uniref:helix-turn-helix domain-containing protein n=1 Tax=Acidovorax sacchari TaxID=3230736 RepID=UPI0039E3968D